MKRTRWILGAVGMAVGFGLAMGGCGGGHDYCYECGQQSFAGIYEGSGINSTGVFSANITISQTGSITGTETQLTGGTGSWAVSGVTDGSGNASITLTPASGAPITETGVLGFAGQGVIQVAFYQDGSSVPIPLSLANATGLFSGNYTGSYSLTGSSVGNSVVQVDVNGNITGTLTPTSGGVTSTISGSITPLGVATVTILPTGGSPTTYTGGAAYNISEQLLVTAVNGSTTLSMNLAFQSNARIPAFKLRK